MGSETIKRADDFKYDHALFRGVRVQTFYGDVKLTKNATSDPAFLESYGLVVRYSTNKAAVVTAETVAAAAIEMARDLPAMRAALLEALTAMDAAEEAPPAVTR